MAKLQKKEKSQVKATVEIYNCPYCGCLLKGTEKFCPDPDCGKAIKNNKN